MIPSRVKSKQPLREAWTMERLAHERAIALGAAIDNTTVLTYGSALNSYIEFCRLHGFPVEPTTDTFSFYTVFMCHHIRPASVDSYLSGICNQLETHFFQVREIRKSVMVSRTLQGCKRLRGTSQDITYSGSAEDLMERLDLIPIFVVTSP
jgi:hypothetical protein